MKSEDKRFKSSDDGSEGLKAATFSYWQKGHRIVPLIDKTPLVKWKKWQKEAQPLQEFELLPLSKANAFAVICGVKLSNGFYFGVLDLDVEKAGVPFSEEVVHKQSEVAENTPITQLEGTPSGGRHLVYHSRTPVKTKTYDVCGIEVLGERKLCIMAPSRGYKRLNDNTPTELGSLNLTFEAAMEKAGLKAPSPPKTLPSRRKRRKGKAQIRYCCEMALKKDKHISHLMRLAIAAEYKKAGWSEDAIVNLFRTQADFDRNKCLTQVRSADPDKVATCKSIGEWGYCYPECPLYEEEKSKEKIVQVCRIITNDFIAEEIYDPPNLPQFAVSYFDKDEIKIVDTITLGEEDAKGRPIIYTPVFNDHVKKGMVILPRKPVPCTTKEVVDEATAFVFKSFDPCGKDNELKILVLIPISSWILDKERPLLPVAGIGVFAAIIACRGPSGTGKNRLANLLRFLSYHPLIQLSTYRIPSLYRPLDIWKGTLVIDEADVKNTGATSQLIHFLNSRATGTPIGRQNPESPSKCDAFDSFGQTILTQRQHFDDNATEGRTIPYYCDVSEKKIPTLLTKEQILKGYELQDKLLYIRLKYWKKIKIEKNLWVEKVSDHRLNSILLPIMALAKFNPGLKEIVSSNIAVLHEARRKLKAQSDDGVMINTLWEKIESGLWDTHNNIFYIGREKEKYKGVDGEEHERVIPLTASKLSEILNRTSKDIRKIVTSLNIHPENAPVRFRVGKYSYRGILFDIKKMEKRLREFVVDYENNSLYKELGVSVPDVPDVPVKPSGALPNFLSQKEETETIPVSSRGTSGTCGTSVDEKKEIIYVKAREIVVDRLFSKFALADALEGQVDRNEVFQLLEILDKKEGKITAKGPEWYMVV